MNGTRSSFFAMAFHRRADRRRRKQEGAAQSFPQISQSQSQEPSEDIDRTGRKGEGIETEPQSLLKA